MLWEEPWWCGHRRKWGERIPKFFVLAPDWDQAAVTGSGSSLGAIVQHVVMLPVRKLFLLLVKVTCLSLLWLYPLLEWSWMFPCSSAPALGQEEVVPCAAHSPMCPAWMMFQGWARCSAVLRELNMTTCLILILEKKNPGVCWCPRGWSPQTSVSDKVPVLMQPE